MLLLPKNLSSLAKIAGKDASRYSFQGIRIVALGSSYRVEATDGRRAAMVSGKSDPVDDFPDVLELPKNTVEPDANNPPAAIVHRNDYKKAFMAIPKKRKAKPVFDKVACSIGPDGVKLATVNESQCNLVHAEKVNGQFPSIQSCVPCCQPTFAVRVDAAMLAELLKVASQFASNTKDCPVIMEFYQPRGGKNNWQSIVIRCRNDNQQFTGILVPLVWCDEDDVAFAKVKAKADNNDGGIL